MSDLYIKAVAPSASRSTATLMKTGQTTSYRTGDDGDLEAGRSTSFLVLAENNPFGNTNRFTDELGGSTYTNNIVIDWSTYNGSNVLGYRRTISAFLSWDSSIDAALALSIGTFTSGWRVPNVRELFNISKYEGTTSNFALNYTPFNIAAVTLWSSTTVVSDTRFAYCFTNNASSITSVQFKTTSQKYLAVRTFTVTGTTLS